MAYLHELLCSQLPNLDTDNYRVTSDPSFEYNCIGWAAGTTKVWWWPVPGRYWPAEAPREETIEAFAAALIALGYAPCATWDFDARLEKVVLYARAGLPTHAARQLPTGWWTSKLGPHVDIEHATPEVLAGGSYGDPAMVFSRELDQFLQPGK